MRTQERLGSITIQDGGVIRSLCKYKTNLAVIIYLTSNCLKNVKLEVYSLSLYLERSDYLAERSDQRMEPKVAWNEVVMERSDRNSISFSFVIRTTIIIVTSTYHLLNRF